MVKLYEKFKNRGLVILAVDIKEKRKSVKRFMEKQKMPFPVLLDKNGRVARDYNITSHPAHFLIDRQGKIIGKAVGARDWTSAVSQNLIRILVAEKTK